FRKVPTFGCDTIQQFCNDVSGLKQLAMHDYEDILQCIAPVIEGLLPAPHNEIILDLVFKLVTWQAFAKLRLHTDETLKTIRLSTKQLSKIVRKFCRTTCEAYHMVQLPREEAARGCREAEMQANKRASQMDSVASIQKGPKLKKLNLEMYKWHALGNYATTIMRYGTTDNYTMQIISYTALNDASTKILM
ncbi:uncharacterized protein LAESUDRAFT_657285, partial [Laetiporus sulphureus 93-53]